MLDVHLTRPLVAGEHGQGDELTAVFLGPGVGVVEQERADAVALVCLGHRDVGDVAVVAVGEEVLRFLQVDEADRLAILVLGDEDVAVGRLLVEMPDQVGFDALEAVGFRAAVWQREIDETMEQAKDELVIVAFGETDQERGIAHRVGHRCGGETGR